MSHLMKADIRVLPNNDYSAACVYAQTCVAALSMNAKDTRPKALYIGTVKGDVVSELKGTIFSNMLKDVFKLVFFCNLFQVAWRCCGVCTLVILILP